VVQALELDGRTAVDRLADVEPRQVEVTVERVERERGRVRVEDLDAVLVEVGRELRPFEQPQPPLDARRRAAHVSLLAGHLRGHRATRPEMRADDDGIEARAEVVDVRDGDVLDPPPPELVERPGASERGQQVAMARGVERRHPVVEEQLAVLGEPKRDEL
jgi:hypothetical protein